MIIKIIVQNNKTIVKFGIVMEQPEEVLWEFFLILISETVEMSS